MHTRKLLYREGYSNFLFITSENIKRCNGRKIFSCNGMPVNNKSNSINAYIIKVASHKHWEKQASWIRELFVGFY